MTEQSLFIAALDRNDPAERAALLDKACAADAAMRDRIEQLLRRHDQPGPSFFDSPARAVIALAEAHDVAAADFGRPGSAIGPYFLLEQIGQGGFGVVFKAVQRDPIRREVALKVIKPGMDTRQVIARFDAERQALALMDHPNIAKVLDAGTTESGRPYFVMELVRAGVPITDYSDRHRLPLRQRLELFVPVCRAVQHAHTKGVIHRDIKPTNILVTEEDGVAVPKVIDFGVAKATGEPLTDGTPYTTAAQVIGTPLYMSPEQAEWGGGRGDVDTRSDVYALGAVLYELLSGATPFDRERLRTSGYDEIRRIIREEDPPPPSSRTGAATDAGPVAAPASLRGELDWIVLRALEKDPERRYQTAAALAADVRRYLNDEPVRACPPSTLYRMRKWARRNKAPFAAASSALVLVVLGVAALAVSNAMTRRAHARAAAAQRVAEERADEIRKGLENLKFANVQLDRGRWYVAQSRWDHADAAFTSAVALRPDHASAWGARGNLFAELGLWDMAAPDVAREVALSAPDYGPRWLQHALLRLAVDDTAGYRDVARQMGERFEGSRDSLFAHDLVRVRLLAPGGEHDVAGGADPRRTVTTSRRLVEYYPRSWYAMLLLGTALYRSGDYERATEPLLGCLGASDWEARLLAWPTLAMAYHRLGREAEARRALDETAAVLHRWNSNRERAQGDPWAHPQGAALAAGPLWPVPWWDVLDCELRYREAKRLIDGDAPAPDPLARLLRARGFARLRRSGRAVAEYEAALALRPRDDQVRFEAHRARAFDHALHGRWAQAGGEYVNACGLRPDDVRLWHSRAIAHFAAGDAAAYRKTCDAVLERFGDTADELTACRVVAACVMSPDAGSDPGALLTVADVAARQWHFGSSVRGAALVRAGRHGDAIDCFARMAEVHDLRAWECCFLAIAHHRLGHRDDADRWLAQASRWVEAADRRGGDDPAGALPTWGDWTESSVCRLLLAEAAALIRAGAP